MRCYNYDISDATEFLSVMANQSKLSVPPFHSIVIIMYNRNIKKLSDYECCCSVSIIFFYALTAIWYDDDADEAEKNNYY